MKKVTILSVPVCSVTREQVVQTIEAYIASGRSHSVVTVNNEFIVEAQSHNVFRDALRSADLSVADSAGVMWAASVLGQPLPERIPGADLAIDLASIGEQRGWKFYLLGGDAGVAEKAARELSKRYPKLLIVGAEAGVSPGVTKDSFNEIEVEGLIERINKAHPDILLIAFGAPRQELFVSRYKEKLGVPAMIGVGGTLDFLAGTKKRAPAWLRSLNLEWLWRLIQEPKRLKRILVATIVFPFLVLTRSRRSLT